MNGRNQLHVVPFLTPDLYPHKLDKHTYPVLKYKPKIFCHKVRLAKRVKTSRLEEESNSMNSYRKTGFQHLTTNVESCDNFWRQTLAVHITCTSVHVATLSLGSQRYLSCTISDRSTPSHKLRAVWSNTCRSCEWMTSGAARYTVPTFVTTGHVGTYHYTLHHAMELTNFGTKLKPTVYCTMICNVITNIQ